MMVTDFPDNSVVCHAHRETGAPQDTFISGSALAVNIPDETGFFPEVYNEDWLFFYDDARARRLGWSGANATQLPYDPFDQPERTKRQEFGDVLAEGLYALLDQGAGVTEVNQDYWKFFLDARWRFLENIIQRYWRDDAGPAGKDHRCGADRHRFASCKSSLGSVTCTSKPGATISVTGPRTMKSVARASARCKRLCGQLRLKPPTPASLGQRHRHVPHELATLPLTTPAEIPDFQAETSSPSVWRASSRSTRSHRLRSCPRSRPTHRKRLAADQDVAPARTPGRVRGLASRSRQSHNPRSSYR